MSQVTSQTNLQNITNLPDLARFVSKALSDIVNQVNGNLQIVNNISAAGPYTVNFSGSGVSTKVNHNFGSVPMGYWVINVSEPMVVYTAPVSGVTNAWTDTVIYLESNAGGTAILYLV